jgi:hypothetical protein|tara:strand:- start:385 stop:639 length:255 start_codon:yes stop_codon:yes gene_type:complete
MSDEKQQALEGEMGIPSDTTNEHDRTYENEGNRDLTPMVQISLKEYDKLKEKQHYITDKAMIDIIDNLERLVRALRKHIVRTEV